MPKLSIIIAALLSQSNSVSAQRPDIDEINAKVKKATKQFWEDQFLPWKETGFTEDMILGGKKIYHARDYLEKTTRSRERGGLGGEPTLEGNQMQLWTIIGKEVYVELSPDWEENEEMIHYMHHFWGSQIRMVMDYGLMPEKVQFWTRTVPDVTWFEDYDGTRLDLLHPMMWFDGQPGKYNMIVQPDPYMTADYLVKINELHKQTQNYTPWEEKKDIAYFHGKMTGKMYDENQKFIGRLQLLHFAFNNPDYASFTVSSMLDQVKPGDFPSSFDRWRMDGTDIMEFHEDFSTVSGYKYMIGIDGNAAGWGRGPLIMASDSVLLAIESHSQPLYMESIIPWVHYVPIKKDLSDLKENIQWLRDNDDKAKEIALNSKALYKVLYNIQNLVEDCGYVFKKYASMMKYEPVAPDKKFKYCYNILKDGHTRCGRDGNEEDGDDDDDFDEGEQDEDQEEKEDL